MFTCYVGGSVCTLHLTRIPPPVGAGGGLFFRHLPLYRIGAFALRSPDAENYCDTTSGNASKACQRRHPSRAGKLIGLRTRLATSHRDNVFHRFPPTSRANSHRRRTDAAFYFFLGGEKGGLRSILFHSQYEIGRPHRDGRNRSKGGKLRRNVAQHITFHKHPRATMNM